MFFPWQRTERDPLWTREMRERWRRPITLFFVTAYVVGLCWFAYSLYSSLVPVGAVELGVESRGIGHRLFVALLTSQIGIWIPVALLLAAPTIAAERERRSLSDYLLAGLSPRQIVRAKFASIATFTVVMCAVPLPVIALCFPLGGLEPLELFAGALLQIAVAIFCAATGLLISVGGRRVTSAMQSAVIVALIFLLIGVPLLSALIELPSLVWLLFAVLLTLGTFSLVTGCEDGLRSVSNNLEQDEQSEQAHLIASAPRVPSPPPARTPAPTPVGLAQHQRPTAPSQIKNIPEELLEGTSWDLWIEKIAAFSAIAQREVRVGLRASRLRMVLSPDTPTYQFSPWAWVFFGICGMIIVAAVQIPQWWYFGLTLVTIGALISTTSGSSAAFTREREQRMLAQLQMCPFSPLEIVFGKIAATLLLVTRGWGGALLGMFIVGLSQGVLVTLEAAILVILTLLFAATMGTLLSLVCHHTAVATTGTLGALLIAFVLLPAAPTSLTYFFPVLRTLLTSFPLGPMWIEPMSAIRGTPYMYYSRSSLSLPEASLRLVCSLVVSNTLLILATTRIWSGTRPDDVSTKTRFWERDISRSLR